MRHALAVVVGLAVVSTAAAAPRPRGKVVRVERQRATNAPPRVCEIHEDGAGVCFGTEPVVGDIVMVMDESGVLAESRVTSAEAFKTSGAACNGLWNIKSDLVRGNLADIGGRAIGVVDHDIHPRKGRVMTKDQLPPSPSGDPNETVMIAVDREGDRVPDIFLVQSSCDGTSAAGGGSCLDAWSRMNGRMVRVQQTNFAICGL